MTAGLADAADLKTYRNREHGFSMRYPQSWVQGEEQKGQPFIVQIRPYAEYKQPVLVFNSFVIPQDKRKEELSYLSSLFVFQVVQQPAAKMLKSPEVLNLPSQEIVRFSYTIGPMHNFSASFRKGKHLIIMTLTGRKQEVAPLLAEFEKITRSLK